MLKRSVLRRFLKMKLKAYFLTGLVVVGPIGLTVAVVQWIVVRMDALLYRIIPAPFRPDQIFGFRIPGLGLLVSLLLILLVGVLTANYFGKTLLGYSERLMFRIPLVKGIYTLFKQVADTVLGADRKGFRQVVMVEYPRRGIWCLGFLTGVAAGEVQRLTDRRVLNVFIPTTPNPTSGFYILVPEEDARVLSMTVEEAFKLIVSGGMVTPPERRHRVAAGPEAPVAPGHSGKSEGTAQT